MQKLIAAFPVILAALYYALSPFFTELTRKGYTEYLDKVDAEWRGNSVPLPPHRTSQALGTNIDWIIDAPQMVPCLLLPLATAIFALNDNGLAAVILSAATILICVATLWIYSQSPIRYRSFRIIGHRYTVVSAFGIVLNLTAAAMLLALQRGRYMNRSLGI
jgi:hypothetical protein